ncbi:hypothetical protein [Verrucomicrobium sp. BvORR106]|uniref:hypothetical protein n=1 Tax=Verrucomicrobium sp. BvORR106 TaxID=1403819 RepID=UPI002241001C|nr:hypothetical protein [Verrucomicrobium sp. BvORR106]
MRFDDYITQFQRVKWEGEPLYYLTEDSLKVDRLRDRLVVMGKPLRWKVIGVVMAIALTLAAIVSSAWFTETVARNRNTRIMAGYLLAVGVLGCVVEVVRARAAKNRGVIMEADAHQIRLPQLEAVIPVSDLAAIVQIVCTSNATLGMEGAVKVDEHIGNHRILSTCLVLQKREDEAGATGLYRVLLGGKPNAFIRLMHSMSEVTALPLRYVATFPFPGEVPDGWKLADREA